MFGLIRRSRPTGPGGAGPRDPARGAGLPGRPCRAEDRATARAATARTGPAGAWAAGRGSLRRAPDRRAEPRAAAFTVRATAVARIVVRVRRPWFTGPGSRPSFAFARRASIAAVVRGPPLPLTPHGRGSRSGRAAGGTGPRSPWAHGHGCPGGCGMPGDHDGRPGGSDRATGRDRAGPEHRSAGMTGMCGVRRAGPRAAGRPQTRQHLATAATAGGGQQDIGVVGTLPEKSEIRRNGPGGAAGACRTAPAAQGRRPSRAPATRPPATTFLRTARGPTKSANSSE